MLVVPEADWQGVPAAQRAAIDRQQDAELAAARAELASATAGMAEPQRAQAAAGRRVGAPSAAAVDPDSDPWTVAIHDHDQARSAAFARVEAARDAWQRADRTWRELRLDAASAHVAMAVSKRELVRAQTIDRNLPGEDHYETAPLRGQFSRAQQRWHALATATRQARAELERTSTTLASAKEAYAQLMRNGPMQVTLRSEADQRAARLELTGWTITRSDIARRRGLRHYLETVRNAPPQLRKISFRLSPPPPIQTARTSAPAGTPRPHITASMKPWEDDASSSPPPAATPAPAATRARPAAPPATSSMKPWDTDEPVTATKAVGPASPPGGLPRSARPASPATAGAPAIPTAHGAKQLGPELPPGGLPRPAKPAPRPSDASPAAPATTPVEAPVSPREAR